MRLLCAAAGLVLFLDGCAPVPSGADLTPGDGSISDGLDLSVSDLSVSDASTSDGPSLDGSSNSDASSFDASSSDGATGSDGGTTTCTGPGDQSVPFGGPCCVDADCASSGLCYGNTCTKCFLPRWCGNVSGYATTAALYADNPFRNLSPIHMQRLVWAGSALVGMSNSGGGLTLIDVSTPTAPVIQKSVATSWSGDLAGGPDGRIYLANSPNVDIYDADLTKLGSVAGPGYVNGIALAGANLVILGSGVSIVDVSDPASPIQLSLTPFAVSGAGGEAVAVDGTLAAVETTKGLEMWSLANPAAPVPLGRNAMLAFYNQVVLVPGGGAILSSTEEVVTVDISDPTMPKYATQYLALQSERLVLDGTTLFLAPFISGAALEVADVSQVASPRRLGSIADGSGARDVAVDANWIYMATDDGLMVVPRSEVQRFPPTVPLGDYAMRLTSDDTRVFVTAAKAGLFTFSLTNPAQPTIIDQIAGFPYANDVCVAGTQLLYAPYDALQIYDISQPGAPVFQSTLVPASDVAVAGGRAFVSDGGKVSIYDWSNPTSPALLATTPSVSKAMDRMWATSDRIYAAYPAVAGSYFGGFYVFDVSTPSAPSLAGDYNGVVADGIVGDDAHVFVSNGLTIAIADVSSLHSESMRGPLIPPDITHFFMPCETKGLSLDQGRLFVGCSIEGVAVLNVVDPSAPWLEGSYQTPSYAQQAIAQNGFLYVANWDSGLTTIPYAPVQLMRVAGSIAEGADLDYSATWAAPQPYEQGVCTVSAGTCQVMSFDGTAGTATFRWTLPAAPGDASLYFAVGTWNRLTRGRDTLTVP